jgi:hypothetical protein
VVALDVPAGLAAQAAPRPHAEPPWPGHHHAIPGLSAAGALVRGVRCDDRGGQAQAGEDAGPGVSPGPAMSFAGRSRLS